MNAAAAFNIKIKYLFWSKNAFCILTHFLFIQPQNKHFLPKVGWVSRRGTLRSEKQREFERRQVKALAGQGRESHGRIKEFSVLVFECGEQEARNLCTVILLLAWELSRWQRHFVRWPGEKLSLSISFFFSFSLSLAPPLTSYLPSFLSSIPLFHTPFAVER